MLLKVVNRIKLILCNKQRVNNVVQEGFFFFVYISQSENRNYELILKICFNC